MSDAAFSGIAALAMAVYRRFELVSKNRENCEILVTRTKSLQGAVERLKSQGRNIKDEQDSIHTIEGCFRDCDTFLAGVKKEEDSFATMFFRGGNFARKLQNLKDRFDACLLSLQFSVIVTTSGAVKEIHEDGKMAVEHKGAAARGKVVALASPRRAAGPAVLTQFQKAAVERKAKESEDEQRAKAANDDELIVAGKPFSKKEVLSQMKLLNSILKEQGHPELAMDLDTNFDAGNKALVEIDDDALSKGTALLVCNASHILSDYFDACKAAVVASIKLRIAQQ